MFSFSARTYFCYEISKQDALSKRNPRPRGTITSSPLPASSLELRDMRVRRSSCMANTGPRGVLTHGEQACREALYLEKTRPNPDP